jgi:hypothetical protein
MPDNAGNRRLVKSSAVFILYRKCVSLLSVAALLRIECDR